MLGAYLAGVGVNAIIPARGGDVLKLYLVHHRVEGTTYPTLGATLIVETLFDLVVAAGILAWALTIGVLPGLGVTPPPAAGRLELAAQPQARVADRRARLARRLARSCSRSRSGGSSDFKERVRQGFAILGDL